MARRLAAILAADVVGYSRLMAADEAGTHARLKALRKGLIEPKIAAHRGRTVKLTGDGALVEFASVVDAVECAAAIQKEVAQHQAVLPEHQRIAFRIGINIGDIIVEDNDIYGDGVNVAARLEQLAAPGGICVSRTVYNHAKNKLAFGFELLGAHKVKNIPEPVTVYRVLTDPGRLARTIGLKRAVTPRRRFVVYAAMAIAIALIGGGLWRVGPQHSMLLSGGDLADSELAPEPSIAVLPFANISDDPKLDYFSDGITEDIITELSRFPDLQVVARNSSFTYKGKAVKAREAASDLGVRYLLEGSVRRSGEEVRITAQLIDGATGHHVWAERFDETGEDVFTLQDEVTTKIIGSIAGERGQIRQAGYRHAWGREAATLDEYDYFLRIHSLIYRFNREDMFRAKDIAEDGLRRFPESSLVRIKLGWTLFHLAWNGWSEDPARDYERAFKLVNEGLAREQLPPVAEWHGRWLLTQLLIWYGKDPERAIIEAQRTAALVPNDAETRVVNSRAYLFAGRPDEALAWINQAMQQTPIVPEWFYINLGWAYYLKGQHQEAAAHLEKFPWPDFEGSQIRAANYIRLGQTDKARAAVEQLLEVRPDITLASLRQMLPYKDEADLRRQLAELKQAGVPEGSGS
jgi:TolB-like protein/class 3 adenylate cyclase